MIIRTESKFDSDLKLISAQLYQMQAEQLPAPDETDLAKTPIKINKQWTYRSTIDKENKILALYPKCNLTFTPEGIAKLSAEYEILYRIKVEELKEEFVQENAEELADPCADINTMILGVITDKMVGAPITVPPFVRLKKASES